MNGILGASFKVVFQKKKKKVLAGFVNNARDPLSKTCLACRYPNIHLSLTIWSIMLRYEWYNDMIHIC